MITKNILLTMAVMLFTMLSFTTIHNFEAFAEEEETGYKWLKM